MNRRLVLVIRGDDGFSEMLRHSGFEVLNLELIGTEPLDDLSDLERSLGRIDQYDGVFITSPVAAEIFVRHLNGQGITFTGKVYVLGRRTMSIMETSGLDVVSGNEANTADELIKSFEIEEFEGKHLLFIRGDRSLGTISKMLQDVATVNETVVYRTKECSPGESAVRNVSERLRSGEIEQICFFSPSAVESFRKLFGIGALGKLNVAAIGETTARSASEAGMEVSFVSPRATAEDFAAGLAAFLKNN